MGFCALSSTSLTLLPKEFSGALLCRCRLVSDPAALSCSYVVLPFLYFINHFPFTSKACRLPCPSSFVPAPTVSLAHKHTYLACLSFSWRYCSACVLPFLPRLVLLLFCGLVSSVACRGHQPFGLLSPLALLQFGSHTLLSCLVRPSLATPPSIIGHTSKPLDHPNDRSPRQLPIEAAIDPWHAHV